MDNDKGKPERDEAKADDAPKPREEEQIQAQGEQNSQIDPALGLSWSLEDRRHAALDLALRIPNMQSRQAEHIVNEAKVFEGYLRGPEPDAEEGAAS